jgi:hypothetical protein
MNVESVAYAGPEGQPVDVSGPHPSVLRVGDVLIVRGWLHRVSEVTRVDEGTLNIRTVIEGRANQ